MAVMEKGLRRSSLPVEGRPCMANTDAAAGTTTMPVCVLENAGIGHVGDALKVWVPAVFCAATRLRIPPSRAEGIVGRQARVASELLTWMVPV